ncbi:MAG: FCD domain-containing protein, partial [Pseudorhodoplanes sp.]
HCLERAVAVVESGDRHACFAEFTQLREILFDGCGNRLIFDTEQKLRARISFLRLLTLTDDSRLKDTVVEHEAIVSAIEKRDVEGARIACEKHVASAGKVALKLLETRYQGKAGR